MTASMLLSEPCMAKLVSWCSATPGPVMPHWIKIRRKLSVYSRFSLTFISCTEESFFFVLCSIKCIFCIRGEKSQTFLRQKRKQDWKVINTFHNHVTGFIFINVIWYVITHRGGGGGLRPLFQALTTRLLRSLPEKCRGLDGMSGVGVEISRDGALWSPVTSQAVKRGTGGRSDQTEQL